MISLKKLMQLVIIGGLFQSIILAQEKTDPSKQSVELGNVSWYRNYDEAVIAGKKSKKNIVILFQEVPGCATCRNYGDNVLSHPLMVEALENSFIPLVIFNNKDGRDKKILEKFKEPSWNNPVVRVMDTSGNDIVKGINRDYTAITLIKKLKEVLTVKRVAIPLYMDLLEQELVSQNSNKIEESTYQMYCFWTGEKQLGKVYGVVDVESGFANHHEVVKVKHDNTIINKTALDTYAKKQGFKPVGNSKNYNSSKKDIHYYLQNSIYKYLPLSVIQQTKVNSALGSNQPIKKYLSPSQITWINSIKNGTNKNTISLLDKNIEDAWVIMKEKS